MALVNSFMASHKVLITLTNLSQLSHGLGQRFQLNPFLLIPRQEIVKPHHGIPVF